jgi:uncharacterized protein (DUF302 family)
MTFGFATTIMLSFEEAVERVKQELGKEGFGIITSIDMREAFRAKLNAEFKPYVILGACNPSFALKALQMEEAIGLLLPCNVVVAAQGSRTMVAAFDPHVISSLMTHPAVEEFAREIRARLERALSALPDRSPLTAVPA